MDTLGGHCHFSTTMPTQGTTVLELHGLHRSEPGCVTVVSLGVLVMDHGSRQALAVKSLIRKPLACSLLRV